MINIVAGFIIVGGCIVVYSCIAHAICQWREDRRIKAAEEYEAWKVDQLNKDLRFPDRYRRSE